MWDSTKRGSDKSSRWDEQLAQPEAARRKEHLDIYRYKKDVPIRDNGEKLISLSDISAAMAISRGWTKLVGPILIVGTLGYIIGNYFGIFLGNWFSGL